MNALTDETQEKLSQIFSANLPTICRLASSDFDIFLEIQYASCVFGLAFKSFD
jgi:hypothetical protein